MTRSDIMETIKYFRLCNNAALVARMAVICEIPEGENVSRTTLHKNGYRDICAAGERTLDLSELRYGGKAERALPDGTIVRLKAEVVWGKSKTSEKYIYSSKSDKMVSYKIKGTTLNNSLIRISNGE